MLIAGMLSRSRGEESEAILSNWQRQYGLDRGQSAALLISECQPAIIDPNIAMFRGLAEAVESRGMLARINNLAACCRDMNVPIIHCIIRISAQEDDFRGASPLQLIMRRNMLLKVDSPASAIHPSVDVQPGDIISERSEGITAFHGSDLESTLRRLCVDTAILTGVSTNIALVGMSIEAVNRGFGVVIPEDCTAGATPETHAHAINHTLPALARITESAAVIAQLEGRRRDR